MPSADGLDIINKLRRENLKDLLGTLTKAQESEVTASLKEMGKTDPANLTAAKIAQTLAGSSETCELGENADAKTVGLLGFEYHSAAASR